MNDAILDMNDAILIGNADPMVMLVGNADSDLYGYYNTKTNKNKQIFVFTLYNKQMFLYNEQKEHLFLGGIMTNYDSMGRISVYTNTDCEIIAEKKSSKEKDSNKKSGNKSDKKSDKKKEMILTIMIAMVFLSISMILVAFADQHTEMEYRSYIVKAGDTLWSLADSCGGSLSIVETMEMIRNKNKISGSLIYSGQIVELPIFN